MRQVSVGVSEWVCERVEYDVYDVHMCVCVWMFSHT